MESVVRTLRAEIYREQLAVCEQIRQTLSNKLNNPALTDDERIALGHRCNAALHESYALRLMLELIDRKDREENQARVSKTERM
jgi:hypothetical protein